MREELGGGAGSPDGSPGAPRLGGGPWEPRIHAGIIALETWRHDCMDTRGVVLTGAWVHWCHEWDGLPVDETTPEFQHCTCFPDHPRPAPKATRSGAPEPSEAKGPNPTPLTHPQPKKGTPWNP